MIPNRSSIRFLRDCRARLSHRNGSSEDAAVVLMHSLSCTPTAFHHICFLSSLSLPLRTVLLLFSPKRRPIVLDARRLIIRNEASSLSRRAALLVCLVKTSHHSRLSESRARVFAFKVVRKSRVDDGMLCNVIGFLFTSKDDFSVSSASRFSILFTLLKFPRRRRLRSRRIRGNEMDCTGCFKLK
jgi:hypothetical protein